MKLNKKSAVGGALILAGVAFFVFKVVIGGPEETAAKNMVLLVEDYKGPKFKEKFSQLVLDKYTQLETEATPEEKAKTLAEMKAAIAASQADFNYASISPLVKDGVGYAVIKSPVITVVDPKKRNIEFVLDEVAIGRDGKDPSRLYYTANGEVKISHTENGQKIKAAGISFTDLKGEQKESNGGKDFYYKFVANNVGIIEGKSNTTMLKIASIAAEQENKLLANGKVSQKGKQEYVGIAGGDMVKMMVGDLPPLTIRLDYAAEGDSVEGWYKKVSEVKNGAATPAAFTGNLKLNNFEILLGDAGLKLSGDFNSKPQEPENAVTAKAKLMLVNYKKLEVLVAERLRMPPEMLAKYEAFLSEIATQESGSFVFGIEADSVNKIMKINGKTEEEIMQIYQKHFPPAALTPTEVK